MTEFHHLVGTEGVERAARQMADAAERVSLTAQSFSFECERAARAGQEFLDRLEAILQADRKARGLEA